MFLYKNKTKEKKSLFMLQNDSTHFKSLFLGRLAFLGLMIVIFFLHLTCSFPILVWASMTPCVKIICEKYP